MPMLIIVVLAILVVTAGLGIAAEIFLSGRINPRKIMYPDFRARRIVKANIQRIINETVNDCDPAENPERYENVLRWRINGYLKEPWKLEKRKPTFVDKMVELDPNLLTVKIAELESENEKLRTRIENA